jgi:hypothetical protein
MVLVDTSVWIFALKKSPLLPLKEKIDLLLRDELILIFGMIKLELLEGTKSQREFTRLKNRWMLFMRSLLISLYGIRRVNWLLCFIKKG